MQSEDANIVAVVPARKGSKGVPGKNRLKLNNTSITSLALLLGIKSSYVKRVLLSTDDDELIEEAKNLEIEMPYKRPGILSSDSSKTYEIIEDFLKNGIISCNDFILLLQPTTPLRSVTTLDKAIKDFLSCSKTHKSLVSMVDSSDTPIQKLYYIDKFKNVSKVISGDSCIPRQAFKKVFKPNGAFYLSKVKDIVKSQSFCIEKILPFVMDKVESINIDNDFDVVIAQHYYKQLGNYNHD